MDHEGAKDTKFAVSPAKKHGATLSQKLQRGSGVNLRRIANVL
jgi:hypothetical protein